MDFSDRDEHKEWKDQCIAPCAEERRFRFITLGPLFLLSLSTQNCGVGYPLLLLILCFSNLNTDRASAACMSGNTSLHLKIT